MPKKKETSEFGKGFIYNLVLFAKHFERIREYQKNWAEIRSKTQDKSDTYFTEEGANSLWFNVASDHFYDLIVPPRFKKTKVGALAMKLQQQALYFRRNDCTTKQLYKFWSDFEELTMLIDEILGVKDVEADYN